MAIHPVAQPIDLTILEGQLHVKRGIAFVALSGMAHAYAGHFFLDISSMGGLCYGVAYAVSIWSINAIFRIANINTNEEGPWMARYCLHIFAAPAIATLISAAIGFPIDYNTGQALNMLTIYLVMKTVFFTVLAAFATISVIACIAIIHRMRRDQVTASNAIAGLYNDLRPRLPERIQVVLENIRQRFQADGLQPG